MENKYTRIYKKIHVLCLILLLINVGVLLYCILACFDDIKVSSLLFQVVISFYIITQIDDGSGKLSMNPSNYMIPIEYCKRVAYACFISDIGNAVITSLITSLTKKEFHVSCSITMSMIGVLLLVGAKVYQYGCEQQQTENIE